MSFVHLHAHSEYSLLDGLPTADQMAARVSSIQQPALAITDHGSMSGVIDFWYAAQRHGIKPIIGMEGYITQGRMTEKDDERFHLLLLAENQVGYQNLVQLSSDAQTQGFYYKPRIDHDYLTAHSSGLITTTGCLAGEIPRAIMRNNLDQAYLLMAFYRDLFGPEHFYVEYQWHPGIKEMRHVNETLMRMQQYFGLSAIATNDAHYATPEQAKVHEMLLKIQTGSNGMKMSDYEYYLKTETEMELDFGHIDGALSNTLLIAERCNVDLSFSGYALPQFPTPDSINSQEYLQMLVQRGLDGYSTEYFEQAEYELGVIHRMGFDDYFLIVWDICKYAESNNIWWNVRGSGAGSVVAMALGITGVDPIKRGLMFERFLNPDRVNMPDIDLDFPDKWRNDVVEYTKNKYGADHVAQIITFAKIGARGAIRDAGRALNKPPNTYDSIARLVPFVPSKPATLDEVMNPEHELYSAELVDSYEKDAVTREVVDTARTIEGVIRQSGVHAAGVVICDVPLTERVPLARNSGTKLGGIEHVTQWDMRTIDERGLLKVDFLGLSTLTAMQEAARLIEQRHGIRYDINNIPYDNDMVGPEGYTMNKAWDMLADGGVDGVFQVEGAGMRKLMMEMKPSEMRHIVAAVALFRPGPMQYIPSYIKRMHGEEDIKYYLPELEPILKDTYGIMVFQEQLFQVAIQLAGYSAGDADKLRKAVSKKIPEQMMVHKKKFIGGAICDPKIAQKIWEDIEFFGRYGFNRAHATDYAKITCQTAYLRAHYPIEFFAGTLQSEIERPQKLAKYVMAAKKAGITIKTPDVNASDFDFRVIGDEILFGLGAIKNAASGALEIIIKERQKHGEYRNLKDFCARLNLKRIGARTLTSLIYAGALDVFGKRSQLMGSVSNMQNYSKQSGSGQLSLFDLGNSTTESILVEHVDDPGLKYWLDNERDHLGAYISQHPLDTLMLDKRVQNWISDVIADINESYDGSNVAIIGTLFNIRIHITKRQNEMAFASLEDQTNVIDLVIFPSIYDQYFELLSEGETVGIIGRVQWNDKYHSIVVNEIVKEIE